MFSKSLLVLALAAVHVSGDAVANQTAEADLVGKLRLAPVATDRISLLSSDSEFAFDFFDPNDAATVGKGGKLILANAATFPAVIGTGSAMAAGLLDACSMNTPHTHPRATEMQFSVNNTIRTGMITENGARFIINEVPPGSMTIFPKGSIHFQVNDGCEPALFVSTFNSEDPGALQIAQRFLGLPIDVVGATLGDLGVKEVIGVESQIPDNIAIGTDACLQRCGLKRPSQPTLQQQPRISGNAIPSGTGSGYTYTQATATQSHTTSSPSHTSSPVTHVIQVGLNGLSYTPSNITAAVGDIVTFEFHPKNHTVTQSSFQNPCKALAETSTTGQIGFKSGFVPVAATETVFPTFNITINDTEPIWGYCGQQGPPVHCTSGMVFSINAVEDSPNNFAAFQKLANDSGISAAGSSTYAGYKPMTTSYGGYKPITTSYGGYKPITTSYAGYKPTTTSYGTYNSASAYGGGYAKDGSFLAASDDSSTSEGSNKPSPALIALIAINGVLVVGLVILGVLYFRKRRAVARMSRHKQLYTSISVSGDPIFVAPEKPSQYEDAEGHAIADNTPLTHGLSHGPYYDPHEPGSRPASRLR
ncbi:hypothetical protein B0H11DRAFT_1850878 [Mycena galericulata]|nr:hypothetical protein B0H11DRAFT_1850878 [Mycena galericulata]